jgi:hypothetical protein
MAEFYDIHIQPVPADEVRGLKCVEFGYRSALAVRGFQALINRWLKTFLTPLGSDPLHDDVGTEVASIIGANYDGAADDLIDIVRLSIDSTNEQVRAQDVAGLRDEDESLNTAVLVRFESEAAGFDVWVDISNLAGESLTVPVTTRELR